MHARHLINLSVLYIYIYTYIYTYMRVWRVSRTLIRASVRDIIILHDTLRKPYVNNTCSGVDQIWANILRKPYVAAVPVGLTTFCQHKTPNASVYDSILLFLKRAMCVYALLVQDSHPMMPVIAISDLWTRCIAHIGEGSQRQSVFRPFAIGCHNTAWVD